VFDKKDVVENLAISCGRDGDRSFEGLSLSDLDCVPYGTGFGRRDIAAGVGAGTAHAMEIATRNVPVIEGDIVICPDVSGSMGTPITG